MLLNDHRLLLNYDAFEARLTVPSISGLRFNALHRSIA
jgi:hypothetical protein